MSSLNNFELFSKHLSNIAATWEPLPPDRVHPIFAYRAMADSAIDQLKEASPQLPERLTSSGVHHGARVIGRYCHIAALISKREGYSKASLVHMLQHPTSFQHLAMIAHQPNTIAGDLEVNYGLGSGSDDSLSLRSVLPQYEGTPEYGLIAPGLLADIITMREWIHPDDEQKMCPAHKLGQLNKIYLEFIKICAKDPLLFDTTLRK